MPGNRNTVRALFYGVSVVVIVGVLGQLFAEVLPGSMASRIGHNSEGVVLALLVALWIEFARPRLAGSVGGWLVTGVVAGWCVLIAVLLLWFDLPSRFRTLNETFLAASVVIPYLQARRPLPSRLAVGASAVVLAATILFNRTTVVTDLAEALAVLILVPIGFDVVDRGILDPDATTSPRLRLGWYAGLIVAPIAFSVLQYGIGFSGLFGEATRYAVRVAEAFIALLLVEVYFAIGLGRVGRSTTSGDASAGTAMTAEPGDPSGSSVHAPPR